MSAPGGAATFCPSAHPFVRTSVLELNYFETVTYGFTSFCPFVPIYLYLFCPLGPFSSRNTFFFFFFFFFYQVLRATGHIEAPIGVCVNLTHTAPLLPLSEWFRFIGTKGQKVKKLYLVDSERFIAGTERGTKRIPRDKRGDPMSIDLSSVRLREPEEHPELCRWPPFQRYLVAALERRGQPRAEAVAVVREASAEAGQPLVRRSL